MSNIPKTAVVLTLEQLEQHVKNGMNIRVVDFVEGHVISYEAESASYLQALHEVGLDNKVAYGVEATVWSFFVAIRKVLLEAPQEAVDIAQPQNS